MVDLADNAWHACTFNRRSVGVEMGGFASCGFDAPQLATSAHVFAFLCYHLQIPVRQARAGVGPGIASHKDLGLRAAVITIVRRPELHAEIIRLVGDEHRKGHVHEVWDLHRSQKACLPSPDTGSTLSPVTSPPPQLPDVHTIGGLQQALKMLAYRIAVDGDYGAETRQVVTSFQMHTGIVLMELPAHRRKRNYSAS